MAHSPVLHHALGFFQFCVRIVTSGTDAVIRELSVSRSRRHRIRLRDFVCENLRLVVIIHPNGRSFQCSRLPAFRPRRSFTMPANIRLLCLLIFATTNSDASAQPLVDRAKKIFAEQEAIVENAMRWQVRLNAISKDIASRDSFSHRRLAKYLDAIREKMNAKEDLIGSASIKMLKLVKPGNGNDLRILTEAAHQRLELLRAMERHLSVAFLPRIMREALEDQRDAVRRLNADQKEIVSKNLIAEMLAKEQAKIRAGATRLLAQIRTSGQQEGELGQLQKAARIALEKAIWLQDDLTKLAAKRMEFPIDPKVNAISGLLTNADQNLNDAAKLARVLEHQASLAYLILELRKFEKTIHHAEYEFRRVNVSIRSRPSKLSTRDERFTMLFMGDRIQSAQSKLKETIHRAKVGGGSCPICDGLVVVIHNRITELQSIEADLRAMEKTRKHLNQSINACNQTQEFLSALNVGKQLLTNYQDLHNLAAPLRDMISDQERVMGDMRQFQFDSRRPFEDFFR